jgi:hypothetical protein
MLEKLSGILLFIIFASSLVMASGEPPSQVTDPKEFKILKQKSIDPKTGLPQTLDPNLFKGKARQAYQVAREIPEILARMPCFCECEAFGHENLLDCFVDRHGAG